MSIIQVNTIRSKSGSSAPTCDQGLVVSGITTLGTVRVSSGIVTATTGIVTYYGDGRYLSNAGFAVTYVPNNLRVVGITTFESQAHIGTGVTINSQGLEILGITTSGSYQGDGSTLSGIVTTIVAGTNISIVSTGSTDGTGTVTISAFDDKGRFVPSATGISTSDNVGIGTTNATSKLTVSGNASFTGVVTATTFVGDLTGVATTATTISLVATNSASTTHYVPFAESATGSEEPRTDSTFTYVPSSNILGVGNINATGIVTSGELRVGASGTSITANSVGSVAIGRNTSNFVLEVGPTGAAGTTVNIHGELQASSANITGIITANRYFGNGDGLVGVGSTVQVREIFWATVNNTGLSTGASDWVGGTIWDPVQSVFKFEIGKYGPVNWVLVQCVGGGGGGASGTYSTGGGSGAVVQRLFRARDLPAACTFDVGIGGANSTNGNGGNGSDTFFSLATNSEIRAPGGRGGTTGTNASGGNGGENIVNSNLANGSSSVDSRGGIFSAAGGNTNTSVTSYRVGGSSLYGPSGGGAYYAGTGYTGGTSYNPGGIFAATGIGVTSFVGGMGRGGAGGATGTNGESPGGGGGASASGNASGFGGGGILRIWMW